MTFAKIKTENSVPTTQELAQLTTCNVQAEGYTVVESGFDSWWENRFYCYFQSTGAPSIIPNGYQELLSLALTWLGCGTDHLTVSRTEFENAWSHTSNISSQYGA